MHLEDIFGAQGPLQRALPDFRFRRQQLRMAERIADALAQRSSLIVEAGTGTGKTFAYLVPALLSGARVLISTGTRTLQDQLYAKDLPLVSAAIGRPARVALLKGRSNYLCRHRLLGASEHAVTQLTIDGTDEGGHAGVLARIERWARTTRTGDLSEVHGVSDSHAIWPQVTSTRDNCLGQRCREFSRCHVVLARRAAQEADVVVVNHHLLLADLALKEDGFGDILGSADAVILDEAHQIPDLAMQFFGATVSSRRIENLLKDVRQELAAGASSGAITAASVKQIESVILAVEEGARDVAARVPKQLGRVSWTEASSSLTSAVNQLAQAFSDLAARLAAEDEEAGTGAIADRVSELGQSLERIASPDETDATRAVETTQRGYTLSLLPFDVSDRFRALIDARPSSWIFTSATLSLGEDFSHFAARLGLDSAPTLKIDSPFDYERQSLLYLPTGMPDPSSPDFVRAVVETAVRLIDASRGGAFVLFTSHRALAHAAQLLRARWTEGAPYRLYVQGEAPRERLLADFRDDGAGVLLGTTSFWEGVDVKGEALRLVIIEKLPFASPDDPIVKARIDHYQARGGNAFRDYQLPEAALALKQGVGRLIRSEEDYGAVVICDPRIVNRSYGRVFLASLPVMSMTRDADEAMRFLRRHAPVPA